MRQKSVLRVLLFLLACAPLVSACGGRLQEAPESDELWPSCEAGKKNRLASYCDNCEGLTSDPHLLIDQCGTPHALKIYAGCSDLVVESFDGEMRTWRGYDMISLRLKWSLEANMNQCQSFGTPVECDEWVDLCEGL